MALKYRLEQIVKETVPDQQGRITVYVEIYDDTAPDVVLARTAVQGTDKEEIKAALADKVPAIKTRLEAAITTTQAAQQALDEFEAEEGL